MLRWRWCAYRNFVALWEAGRVRRFGHFLPARREPAAVDLNTRSGNDRGGNDEDAGHYYAPEQAARLLGEDAHAVNLRVYRKELPTVDINGYRWIPEEVVQELLRRVPAPGSRTRRGHS